jgi:LmbE family N-acetylglucosaminyl deacetylase
LGVIIDQFHLIDSNSLSYVFNNNITIHAKCGNMVLTRIIFAPHEDDDVLACGGLILQSLAEDINVLIVYMTDGRACYVVSNLNTGISPDELAKIRKNEALECCEELGVPISNIQFLEIYDQQLSDSINFKAALEVVKTILRSYSTIEAFIPLDEPHPDHRSTHFIVIQAVKEVGKAIPIYQYGLYRPVVGKADLKIKLSPEMLERKIRAYNCHKSQKFIEVNDIIARNNEERFKLYRMDRS